MIRILYLVSHSSLNNYDTSNLVEAVMQNVKRLEIEKSLANNMHEKILKIWMDEKKTTGSINYVLSYLKFRTVGILRNHDLMDQIETFTQKTFEDGFYYIQVDNSQQP